MLTKAEFKELRERIEKDLSKLSEDYGIEIKAGNIKYEQNSFNITLNATKKEVNGKSFEQAEFEKLCRIYGLTADDYMRKIALSGKTYFICGFSRGASKYPIIVKDAYGKQFKAPMSAVC